ncbi:retrovirus-related Pol polyprotein from transposon 17.6 [Trichonephila clavipes]|nr:retrovirus-related Pol polyprotein from transposon 17.6 [Trichonephila clavipes]
MTIGHEAAAAHLGVTKTKDAIFKTFYWPKCFSDVDDFVKTCDECQRLGKPQDKKKAPLKIFPVISEIFTKVNIDASGPLPMTPSGNKYIITALCMSSRYPDAISVANLCSTTVVNALLQIFSRRGFPRELQTDQGTSFMSALTTEFLERFGVKVVRNSVYHPQSNPVERMHRTLKRILRVMCLEAIPDWEKILPQALFALRTVIHDSTGFSPAELVHGKNLRTPLMLLYEKLTEEEHVESSVVDYVFELINRMKRCQRGIGNPTHGRCLTKTEVVWVGPGEIVQQFSETNYVVKFPEKDKTHVYHVNMLKSYHQREENINLLRINPLKHDEEDMPSLELENEMSACNLFSNIPGCTDLAEHDIELESERAIVVSPYRMSPRQIEILKSEGKEARPCIDYRRLNKVTRTQFFPLPNIEELLEKVSAAKYISILDLTRRYWQIPLSPRVQRYASFVTTFGTFKPLRLPFGLKNVPYYFSRLMANLLRNCEDFAVPYLDDIAIFSLAWDDHLKHLKNVFDRLRSAKLHIKPSKCQFAQAYVKYLGHLVGQGLRTHGELKVQVIKDFPIPTNKTQVRAFLGLSGYYRRYIPEFSVIAAPLTDLLKGRN